MRISTTMVMNNYADSLNSKYETINKYSNQLSTTLPYERGSEDPVKYTESVESCKEYTLNEQYMSSQAQSSSWMDTTESTIKSVNNILSTTYTKALEAANGTNSDTDYGTYASDFTSYRDELVSTLNTSFNGQYIFGESTSGNPPFRLNTDVATTDPDYNKLQYYNYNAKTPGYVDVSTLTKTSSVSGTINGAAMTSSSYANNVSDMKLSNNVDLGYSYNMDTATSGLDIIISGYTGSSSSTSGGTTTTIDNTAVNIVDQLTSVINQLSESTPDISGLHGLVTDATNAQSAASKIQTSVGEKSAMLTEIGDRLTDNKTNLTAALGNTMEVDSVDATTKINMAQTVYKETMSMASTILQNSLFDYIK